MDYRKLLQSKKSDCVHSIHETRKWQRWILLIFLFGFGIGCTKTTPKVSDIQQNMNQLDEQIDMIREVQEQERLRREKMLSEIRSMVKDNSPTIKNRETFFEDSPKTRGRSGDIQSIPLDEVMEPSSQIELTGPSSRRASDAEELFNNAYANYNNGEYTTAAEGFLLAYGLADQADLKGRCLYWLGECHYRNHEWEKAITCFTQLEAKFPSHPILSSALLKKGLAFYEKGEIQKAENTLHHLLNTFPLAEEAPLAEERLREWANS